ncbi:MAG: NAD(P)H-binding protein [Acidimicrobiia bacterium]|nr:MAG: NAD(P)H-binding protein [Acidimicrobiia bacterium]
MSKTQGKPILVLGATGKTGRRVVEGLESAGMPVRAGSRAAEPPFDWEDQATWAPVLDGVAKVYITFQPDLAVPGAADAIRAFTAQAVAAGVDQLVLLSGRGEQEAQACEQIVKDAGVDWTLLRASWFFQNLSESFLLEPVLAGHVALPAGDTPEPFIDAGDIAAVAVAVLTEAGHTGQLYELTGPRMLTFAEAIAEVAAATGRDIRYTDVPRDTYKAMLHEAGVPGDYVWLVDYLFDTVLDGRNAHLADGVLRALGRQPRDFREFASETAATGVWNPAAARHVA